jgi:hypothetical protein
MATVQPWWAYIGYSDWGDAATWDEQSNNVHPDFPEVNMTLDQPRDRFQTQVDGTDIVIRGEVSTATDINCISMMFSNIPYSADNQWRVKLDSATPGGTNKLDTGWQTFWASTGGASYMDRSHTLWASDTAISGAIHMEIDISAQTDDNFITIGRLMAGDFMRVPLAVNTALFGFIDEGASIAQRTGVISISKGNPTPNFPFSFYTESRADIMDYMYKFGKLRGGTRPVLLVRDPTDTAYRMQTMQYGLLADQIMAMELSYNYFMFRGTIRGMT